MEPIYPIPEFFVPGTFEEEPPYREGDVVNLHQGGLDGIDAAYDAQKAAILAGVEGFDPFDLIQTSLETEGAMQQQLPQWGPPFIKFVDGRISELEKKFDKAIEKWSFTTQTLVLNPSMQTSSTGGIDQTTSDKATFLEPPPGFTFALHRISIVDVAHNLGNPFTAAGAWWELRVNNDTLFGNSMISGQGQLPVFVNWGTRDAPRIRDGEKLSLFMSGGPASTMLKLRVQGSYDRTIEG